MAEEFIYTNYSVGDIERYLTGRMNAKDMHELERAALKDPFLADAIEGYRDTPFSQTYQHLSEISAAILSEKQPAKIVAMPVKTNYWWRVAAIIALVIITGGGIWHALQNYNANNEKLASLRLPLQKETKPVTNTQNITYGAAAAKAATKKALADKKNEKSIVAHKLGKNQVKTTSEKLLIYEPQKTASASAAYTPKDMLAGNNTAPTSQPAIDVMKSLPSVTVDSTGSVSTKTLRAKLGDDASATAPAASNANNDVVDKFVTNNISPSGPYANQASSLSGKPGVLANTVKSAKLEGFVTDAKKLPLSNALVYAYKGRQTAVTDGKGYFKLNTNDSQLTAMVSSAGYETKQVTLKNNTANYLVINQLPAYLKSVEVVEFKNKRGAKKLVGDSLFPEGGWQSFQEYVYKKLHKEKEMDTTGSGIIPMFGSVEIEFTVDDNGAARDLKITKSLNQQSDAEAMKVVQQWPKWIATKKDKKGKIVIQF